jgi:hypothetical protein
MNPVMVTLRGPGQIDLRDLSDFEAGIAFLALLNQLAPGIKFGELAALMVDGRMAAGFNLFRAVGNLVGDAGSGVVNIAEGAASGIYHGAGQIKDGAGGVLKDTFAASGKAAGDTVRLLTDEKVVDGIGRIGAAYASNGGSEGVRNLFKGSDVGESVLTFFSALGSSFKGMPSNVAPSSSPNWVPWAIGGAAIFATVLLVRK